MALHLIRSGTARRSWSTSRRTSAAESRSCRPTSTPPDYESYLAVVPGRQLAEIYDRWGARLLERNVRVFLQARGNVNKGIRNTLENEPEMFFAYNNGITATAEGDRDATDAITVCCSRSIRNLQIVNGGQTTASIHAALQKEGAARSACSFR